MSKKPKRCKNTFKMRYFCSIATIYFMCIFLIHSMHPTSPFYCVYRQFTQAFCFHDEQKKMHNSPNFLPFNLYKYIYNRNFLDIAYKNIKNHWQDTILLFGKCFQNIRWIIMTVYISFCCLLRVQQVQVEVQVYTRRLI